MNNIITTTSNTGNTNNNEDILKQIKDDDYYMSKPGLEPPRFYYYGYIKALRYGNASYLYVTQDELDFGLKRMLKMSPEERYQVALYRELSSDDWFKGCHNNQCCPECEYYPEYGRIEDQQVIDEHKEHERYYRNKNQIINIDIDEKEFKEFLKDHPSIK